MATLTPAVRRIGSAVVAGLGLMRAPFARDSRRRRQEELTLELLGKVTLVAEGIDRLVEEIHRANLIQHYRLTADQLGSAIEDPSLAAALSTLDGLSEAKRRQLLFVNRQYGSTLLGHRVGALDWGELIGTLRVLARNDVFAEYWDRTAEHRRSLPEDSLEARVGQVLDAIVEELADDPEVWWVVGPVLAPEHTPAPDRAPGAASGHGPASGAASGHAPASETGTAPDPASGTPAD
ncbi:DUF6082 family protein [Streptomyces sp. NPDC002845]